MKIRTAFNLGIGVLLLLSGIYCALSFLQLRVEQKLVDSTDQLISSLHLAAQLRQSSEDLTRMARIYVSTGDPKYREYFLKILDIRNGESPRPDNYGAMFWDKVLTSPEALVDSGQPAALQELMRQAGFTDEEFALLKEAEDNSNELTALEEVAMNAVVGRFQDDEGRFTRSGPPDFDLARSIMFGMQYHAAKEIIMVPIDQFNLLLDQRLSSQMNNLHNRGHLLAICQAAIAIFTIATLLFYLVYARLIILTPLRDMVQGANRLRDQKYSTRIIVHRKNEIAELGNTFNRMGEAIEKDIANREQKTIQLREATRAAEIAEEELRIIHDELEQRFQKRSAELVEANELLLQSQKMEAIGRLAGGVAHDFNNALTVIIGNSDLILASQVEDDPPDTHILNIRKAATHAAELTQQLLAFSRKQIANPRILEVNNVISGIQGMLQRVIGEDIKLITSFSADVGNIRMDPGQVEQVLMNLMVNAREAMPRGGTITIETEHVELDETYLQTHLHAEPGPYAQISVSDTGIGMNEEIQKHLFEPFYTTKETGTGLGMATVYGIVKQNNGCINVYSEVGTGTTFKIYLPITLEHSDAFPSAPDGSGLTGGAETILVVEDDDDVRELTIDILTDLGYEVHVFSNAKDALAHTRSSKGSADLLLTDVVMPGMGGAELAEAIAKKWPSLRVLFMSGYTDDAIATHGVLDEGTNFLQKPFSQIDIAQKIREVLDADRSE